LVVTAEHGSCLRISDDRYDRERFQLGSGVEISAPRSTHNKRSGRGPVFNDRIRNLDELHTARVPFVRATAASRRTILALFHALHNTSGVQCEAAQLGEPVLSFVWLNSLAAHSPALAAALPRRALRKALLRLRAVSLDNSDVADFVVRALMLFLATA